MRSVLYTLFAGGLLLTAPSTQAFDLNNIVNKATEAINKQTQKSSGTSLSSLTENQIIDGLREALKVGTERVVSQIGAVDGYNLDQNIHIPLPDELQQVQKLLNKFGLSALADDVELRLNRAAEQAAPQAKNIIVNAISSMSLSDARAIYDGPQNAATEYFKKVSTQNLRSAIQPIAESSLKDVGAIQAYDSLMGQYKSMPFVPDVKADLVDHTTSLAIRGIFHYLAQEEAAIRENPAKRTTEILKTVFGQ
ncbi:DUF4197 domain-containing protein [Terasakiella sp. A23]|uniref:DUF4197 domain-containing protein n=1 Tax=Terasakiella sp. FCG-A23 TaxID=3080561 RepID=UPI00295594C4|nr:DUF4197 domain-containing protein [Terasakiella sp. A23]MDV7339881.1 DUF4197 domain-containing protein [Terasakiella sp. A23]